MIPGLVVMEKMRSVMDLLCPALPETIQAIRRDDEERPH